MGQRLERRAPDRALRRAHRPCPCAVRDRQSRQGRGRPDDPVREPDARARGNRWADQYRSLSMSVTAAQGFVAAGVHAGIKRRKLDMALIATDDTRPGAWLAVFTQNK